jgi:hypothetical protein
MVHLVTVGSGFQARVLAARLGSEGIVTSLHGAVDGPYPFGDVRVEVDEADLPLARQLLLADEVEEAFVASTAAARRPSSAVSPRLAAGTVAFVAVATSLARVLAV